jgi:release factor glutamine methyltransferase
MSTQPTISVAELIQNSVAKGLDLLDSEWLVLHVLARNDHGRVWLRAHADDILTSEQVQAHTLACQRRLGGEPLAYITGERGFYGLSLNVDARVLDPRPDTETLVDWALDVLAGFLAPQVADLGTGSGAIALALQHHRPDARVVAVDASAGALAVAQSNARRLNLPVVFALGSWFTPLITHTAAGGMHLIASNPPYIAEGDPHLSALHHEPTEALTSGTDGLDDIRHIVTHAPAHLRAGGWLLLEHGHDQALAVQALLQARGFDEVQSRNDLGGNTRCTGGIWRGRSNAG